MHVLERSGADAIQFDDQVMPNKCGHSPGKEVISTSEMVGKIRVAVDARENTRPSQHPACILACAVAYRE